jgi:hypothetical protein
MKFSQKMLAAFGVLLLSLAPLTPAAAAGPGVWMGGHAFGHFGLGAALAHSFFGLAALPLAIVGVAAAAAQSQDQGYGPAAASYGPAAGYYAPPPSAYYAPAPAYYPPAPRYYAPYPPVPSYYPPRASYYAAPTGYYGARPGYYARPGYQLPRRSGYYHYPR